MMRCSVGDHVFLKAPRWIAARCFFRTRCLGPVGEACFMRCRMRGETQRCLIRILDIPPADLGGSAPLTDLGSCPIKIATRVESVSSTELALRNSELKILFCVRRARAAMGRERRRHDSNWNKAARAGFIRARGVAQLNERPTIYSSWLHQMASHPSGGVL
jgi:hypothetical protein